MIGDGRTLGEAISDFLSDTVDWEIVAFIAGMALTMAIIAWLLIYATKISCYQQWGKSGMEVEWALLQGCLVQQHDGTWIPADQYRVIK